MKIEPEPSSEYAAFKNLLNRITSVAHDELRRREAEYKRQAALNPNKPGPKPKRKRSAGRAPVV